MVDEFQPYDVFEIKDQMCSTAKYSSIMQAQFFMTEPKKKPDKLATKFCFSFFNNMVNYKISERYGEATQAAKNAVN